jgi:integrase
MKTNFYIDTTQKDRKGMAPINFYISFRGHRLKFYTGQKIAEDNWDKETQRVIPGTKNTAYLNDLLDVIEEEPHTVERIARINKIDCTVEHLKSQLTYFTPKSTSFFDVFEEFINSESVSNSWTASTMKRWKHLKANLEKFNSVYKLEFDSINQTFANKFIKTQTEATWANVTTKKALRMTIQFVNWAHENKKHYSTSYRSIKIKIKQPNPEGNVVYLTLEELSRVNKLTFSEIESGIEKARDVFLFSCFTGLRYSDLQNLKRSDIKGEFLHVHTIKTDETVKVPLTDTAKEILEKYKDLPVCPIPVISQQKYNDHLKTIGRRAKLDEMVTQVHFKGSERIETTLAKHQLLTSHVGRKTFVTIAVYLDIPLETVAKITGHKSDSIKAYYDIMDSKKSLELMKFNDILKVV